MSTSSVALNEIPREQRGPTRRVDGGMLGGLLAGAGAVVGAIAVTGIHLSYFFQPSGILMVIGGTLAVVFVTTPLPALRSAAARVLELVWHRGADRSQLRKQIMTYVRVARAQGLLGIESMVSECEHPFLRESLILALDVQRAELQGTMETKLRLHERQGEGDARTLESAGGFAPTIGVLGTMVGLVDALRRFSDLPSVASGVGIAFASTFYGLGLANLLLLPLAYRIRAMMAEKLETEEMILEGVLCILDGIHPSLVSERLRAFLGETAEV